MGAVQALVVGDVGDHDVHQVVGRARALGRDHLATNDALAAA